MKISALVMFLCMSFTACRQDGTDDSNIEAGRILRPAQSIILNGKNAEKLIGLLNSAGVERRDAIEGVSWTVTKIECQQFMLTGSGLQSTCDLGLPLSEDDTRGSITRPAKSITLNGSEAKAMAQFLSKIVGVRPTSAIESTVWKTRHVVCSRTYKRGSGVIAECRVAL